MMDLDGAAMHDVVPFAHWTTPALSVKRFAAWFFLAEGPHADVVVDGSEITAHAWMSPRAAVIARDAGDIELPPPTYVSLLRLAESATVAEAFAEVASATYVRFEPHIRLVDGGFVSLCRRRRVRRRGSLR